MMNTPNLHTIIEPFIRIDYSEKASADANWQNYIDLLRSRVAPLIRVLTAAGSITWYSFLVHDRKSGVPTKKRDKGFYVHLRMSLSASADEDSFIRDLPEYCLMTRKMQMPDTPSLDTVDISCLNGSNVEHGWRILGESSEWVLRLLDSHDQSKPVPQNNVAQFLHYLGNQLFVRVAQIPMP